MLTVNYLIRLFKKQFETKMGEHMVDIHNRGENTPNRYEIVFSDRRTGQELIYINGVYKILDASEMYSIADESQTGRIRGITILACNLFKTLEIHIIKNREGVKKLTATEVNAMIKAIDDETAGNIIDID